MNNALRNIRPGLFLALLTLFFGIVMGITFGVNEAGYEHWIAQEIALHPTLHDAESPEKSGVMRSVRISMPPVSAHSAWA